jgi:MFS family permease
VIVLFAVGGIAVSLAVVTAGLLVPTFAALGAIGVASELWDVIAVSYRQAMVPDRLLGRIMAAYRFIAYGAYPIGALVGGVIASLAGLQASFAFGAGATLILIPFLWSALSGVERDPAIARTVDPDGRGGLTRESL